MPIDLNVMLARTALSRNSVWTKICGLTEVANAKEVAHLNPDAIGLNFYSKSSRHIDDATAEAIASEMPETVAIVGVFVNEPPHEIVRRARLMRLSAIQFHGDELPEHLGEVHAELPDVSLIRAWRRGPHGLKPIVDDLQRYQELQIPLAACLLDPAVGKEYGGTGQTLPWQTLRQELDETSLPPLILAGGLHPANIAEAIAAVRPIGVDVASGVEVRPGIKDLEKVRQFLFAIRRGGPVEDRAENRTAAND